MLILQRGFFPWITNQASAYPACYYDHFRLVCHGFGEQAPCPTHHQYIYFGGDQARIALRFKSYSLRYNLATTPTDYQERQDNYADRPDCLWCSGPHLECGIHLLICPHLPDNLMAKVEDLLKQITTETLSLEQPTQHLSPAHRAEALCSLRYVAWPNMTPATCRRALYVMGCLINSYRLHWQPLPDHPDMQNPIWPVQLSPNHPFQSTF